MNEMKAKSKQAARRELHRKLTVILDSNRLAASALTSTINNAYLAATNPQEYQRLIDRVLRRAKDVERLFEARTLQHGASLR
jgi:guanylate kinase